MIESKIGKPVTVALFRNMGTTSYVSEVVFDYANEKDVYSAYVRISEPFEVIFQPLADEQVATNMLATLAEQERRTRLEFGEKLKAIEDMRAGLLAISDHSKRPFEMTSRPDPVDALMDPTEEDSVPF